MDSELVAPIYAPFIGWKWLPLEPDTHRLCVPDLGCLDITPKGGGREKKNIYIYKKERRGEEKEQ